MNSSYGSSLLCVQRVFITGLIVLSAVVFSAGQSDVKNQDLFNEENLVAWCIVPFDSKNRTPKERIDMLKRLKFSQYAYDWRHQHLSSFAEEIRLAKQNGVYIAAVWMWIDKGADSPGKLSADNEKLLEILKETKLMTQLWLGFDNNFYEYDDEATKVNKGIEMLKYLRERTKLVVSGIGLYNHGDWFGEPENQIKILKELNDPGTGLVYNFHHAHSQIESFPALLTKMAPWLWTVNLNGMKKEGPQILTIGSGDKELDMLKALKKSGFKGSLGILGHIEDEDVEQVLKRNLDGLRILEKQL